MAEKVVNDRLPDLPSLGVGDLPPVRDSSYFDPSEEFESAVKGANLPELFSLGHLDSQYTFCTIETVYETDEGICVAPSTAPTDSSGLVQGVNTIVRHSQPCTRKVVRWQAQRQFVKPVCPHWNTGNSNEVLVRKAFDNRNPHQTINHKFWLASGVYVYGFRKEPIVTFGGVEYFIFTAGVPAAERSPTALHSYDQGDFSFVPLNAKWVPVNPKDLKGELPYGFSARAGTPDQAAQAATPKKYGTS